MLGPGGNWEGEAPAEPYGSRALRLGRILALGPPLRGLLRPGMKGDANVIDHGRLSLGIPELVSDLPAGASRFVQRARGYEATIVSGQVTWREGEPTGALPGQLIRGGRS